MIVAALVSLAGVALYAWNDGIHGCEDGARYTSGVACQPTPFNRRFCRWPPRVLMVVTFASLVAVGAMLGTWQRSLMVVALPGFWFIATRPTTVDAPAMALALGAAILWPVSPVAAVALSCASGFVHERGPVFSALYAFTPWLAIGALVPLAMACVRGSSPQPKTGRVADLFVGHSFTGALFAHRVHVDMTNEAGLVWSLRGIPMMMAYFGAPAQSWAALAVAYASRLLGTDTARFLFWAAPVLVLRLPDVPLWMLILHVATFRRVTQ